MGSPDAENAQKCSKHQIESVVKKNRSKKVTNGDREKYTKPSHMVSLEQVRYDLKSCRHLHLVIESVSSQEQLRCEIDQVRDIVHVTHDGIKAIVGHAVKLFVKLLLNVNFNVLGL